MLCWVMFNKKIFEKIVRARITSASPHDLKVLKGDLGLQTEISLIFYSISFELRTRWVLGVLSCQSNYQAIYRSSVPLAIAVAEL